MKNISRNDESGIALMTILGLGFVLTMIAFVAINASQRGIKVSASAADQERAFSVAKAGLSENYGMWKFNTPSTGSASFSAVKVAIGQGLSTSDNYIATMHPSNLGVLSALMNGDINGYIQGSTEIDVYAIAGGSLSQIPNALWGVGNAGQVAVWSSSFVKQADPEYPYKSPNDTTSCRNCSVAVYALGRAGKVKSLQREIQATTSRTIAKISAITNAPQHAYWADLCAGSAGSTSQSTSNPFGVVEGEHHSSAVPATTTTSVHDWMIEATQADYQIFGTPSAPKNINVPSGTAYASNTAVGVGKGEFEAQFPLAAHENASSVAVYESDPNIMYSGHGTTGDVRVYLASTPRDFTNPNAQNLDTIGDKLPHRLVNDKILGTPEQLNLINSEGQVFDLDALRWAAEQFTCRVTGTSSNSVPNGKFCSKAEDLRQAVHSNGRPVRNNGVAVTNDPNAAPVTGRLTFAEFQYNIANAVPMFGMIRVMYPAIADTNNGSGVCNGVPVQLYKTEDDSEKMNWSSGSDDYDGSPLVRDNDGDLGNRAKLIVYGSITIDFFSDDNGNFLFDPGAGEHVLSTMENGESKAEMNVPELVNPALPYNANSAMQRVPLAGGGYASEGSSSNPVNLASPTGGWFPIAEGVISNRSGTTARQNGQMELMNPNGSGVAKLIEVGNSIGSAGGTGTASGYFSAYHDRLNYYYNMLVAVADHGDVGQWPISAFPASMSSNFCRGSEDCTKTGPNHNGDKVHLLFPSGYMHGWKIALTALGMHASEWNTLLDGIDDLASFPDVNSTPSSKGAPFNSAIDTGSVKALDTAAATGLIPNQNLFFFTDTGAGGYPLLTSKWADIPAFIYSGGNLEVQHITNVSGVTYTPETVSWGAESESDKNENGSLYFNGAVISGFGFSKSGGHDANSMDSYTVVVYEPSTVDNAITDKPHNEFIRYAWENL